MIEPSLGGDAVGLPPLFFRSADRLRLEGCVAGLLRDGRSLALSSPREAGLDHYSRLLIARLREAAPQSPPELYFPADTTAMINRFNEAVSALSVQDAMAAAPQAEPPRIWIVHDAGALANHEVQLLARLVQNFPGANIRVVLLLGASTQSRRVFETLDRRFLRWDIEAPTPEQAEAMLAQGREDGCEGAVRALLKKLDDATPGSPPEADPAGIDPLGFQTGTAAKAGAAGKAADVFKFSNPDDAAQSRPAGGKPGKSSKGRASRLGSFLRWLLVVLLLAALSVGVTAWLHPTVFTLDRLDLAKRWAMGLVKPAATALSTAAPADAAAESAMPAPATSAAAAPAAATSYPVPDAAAALAAASPASSPVAEPVSSPASSPVSSPVTSPVAAKPASEAEVEPPSEALAGQAWIQPMSAGTWLVQHAAMPSYAVAQKWQQDFPAISSARIVALYRPNDKLAYFAVVSGPFNSRAEAMKMADSKGVPPMAWVRSVRSVREQFSPSQEPRR